MRIIFATAEVAPIAKTGGLGDVCGSLPQALAALGHDVVVFMPYYREAHDYFERSGHPIGTAHSTTAITWNDWVAELTIFRSTLPGSSVPLYLLANDYFFDRNQIYSGRLDGYDDNLERYTFFCRAVIQACEMLGLYPEILHAHDWHTALLPVYLHSGLRGSEHFRATRSVFTIHNLNYQGIGGLERFHFLGLHDRYLRADALEHFGQVNFIKGGIIFADQITTVSPTYAREIQTRTVGAGLDGLLRSLSWKLTGILNGIDTEHWNPASDPHLTASYDRENLSGKETAKWTLAKESGLKYQAGTPLIGAVSRLVEQKGFQLLIPILPRLLQAGAQVVLLGSGEPYFERAFQQIASQHPEACSVTIGFDNVLAHRIYAGSDLLLVPSLYEPCGLSQMYALRYGALPVVRFTGGLVDTVIPYDGSNVEIANGFGFVSSTPTKLYAATWTGMLNFKDTEVWRRLQQNAMSADFSWVRSAREYETIYKRAVSAG